jgi:flagellar basal-body rod modification protein FlgD
MANSGSVAGITNDQLFQLLISQLQNQDPLDPVSNKDLIDQLTSLNSVQSLAGLNASFAEMLKLQQLTQGVDLIGKTVTYTPSGGGSPVTGQVSSVDAQNGQFLLTVGSDQITLDQIQSVR